MSSRHHVSEHCRQLQVYLHEPAHLQYKYVHLQSDSYAVPAPSIHITVCHHDGQRYEDGVEFTNNCSTCTCTGGRVTCHPLTCDCTQHPINRKCCPQCKRRKMCYEAGRLVHHGHRWARGCLTCECKNAETDCWDMECPKPACANPVLTEGDCCPRCARTDPCHVTLQPTEDSTAQCTIGNRIVTSGHKVHLGSDVCTTCTCKAGSVCCAYNQTCALTQRAAHLPPVITSARTRARARARAHRGSRGHHSPSNTRHSNAQALTDELEASGVSSDSTSPSDVIQTDREYFRLRHHERRKKSRRPGGGHRRGG